MPVPSGAGLGEAFYMVDGMALPLGTEDRVATVQDRRASFALPGLMLATGALICATLSLLVLLGLTPIRPERNIVIACAGINGVFVVGLIYLIAREILRLLRARSKGRAAARLHVRIVALFSIVAITPAILVAIFASITLDVGLDRWFSLRTQAIVRSSLNVAQAYVLENASYLQGQTVSMANDLERNRQLYSLDRTGFTELMTRQARGAACLAPSWYAPTAAPSFRRISRPRNRCRLFRPMPSKAPFPASRRLFLPV